MIVAIGVGCSSSSNKGSTTVSDSGTPVEDGGEEAAAMVCPDDGGSINSLAVPATGDAGANALECEKNACASTFSACAADACCNNTFYDAFTCLAAAAGDGGSASGGLSTAALACFTTAEASSDTNVTALLSCLVGAESTCGIGDGGSKPASDAASDSSATASDASGDGASTATDASGDGAVEQ